MGEYIVDIIIVMVFVTVLLLYLTGIIISLINEMFKTKNNNTITKLITKYEEGNDVEGLEESYIRKKHGGIRLNDETIWYLKTETEDIRLENERYKRVEVQEQDDRRGFYDKYTFNMKGKSKEDIKEEKYYIYV